MKSSYSKIFKHFYALLFLFLLVLTPTQSFASKLIWGVSPSKVIDFVIPPGSQSSLKFTVGNLSKLDKQNSHRYDDLLFKIIPNAVIVNSDGYELPNNNLVTFDKKLLHCKPDKTDSVNVTLNIPKDFPEDSYTVYLEFYRLPLSGIEDKSNQTNITTIKVPIYLGVGDPEQYNKLKTDFSIKNFKLDFREPPKSLFGYSWDFFIQNLNPKNTIDTFKHIWSKEVYVLKGKKKDTVDINNRILVNLRDVSTTDPDKLSNWKYFHLPENSNSTKIINIKFKSESIIFELEDGTQLNLYGTPMTLSNIREQINAIASSSTDGKPTLGLFLDTLRVPKNVNYTPVEYVTSFDIKNTGERETHISALSELFKENTTKVASGELAMTTIRKSENRHINIPIDINSGLSDGDYSLKGIFENTKKVKKEASYNFKLDSFVRFKILLCTILLDLFLILFIYVLIKIIIYLLKNKNVTEGYVDVSKLFICIDNYSEDSSELISSEILTYQEVLDRSTDISIIGLKALTKDKRTPLLIQPNKKSKKYKYIKEGSILKISSEPLIDTTNTHKVKNKRKDTIDTKKYLYVLVQLETKSKNDKKLKDDVEAKIDENTIDNN